jgi:hypothetical protein
MAVVGYLVCDASLGPIYAYEPNGVSLKSLKRSLDVQEDLLTQQSSRLNLTINARVGAVVPHTIDLRGRQMSAHTANRPPH